jgi:chemotaxis protein MotB
MKLKKVFHRHVETDDGESNWLISYADLMTLLWGFFVILTAFSTPDPTKIEKLKEQTAKAMGGEYINPYNEISDRLKEIVSKFNLEKDVKIENTSEGVKISIQSGYFFDSGFADLKVPAVNLLSRIAEATINPGKDHLNFRVVIEGHTDDLPINTVVFPSNWDLSLKRSAEVARLFERLGVKHENLQPIGKADLEPVVKIAEEMSLEDKVKARAQNRRIVIRLQKIVHK